MDSAVGAYWDADRDLWLAEFRWRGQRIHVGRFETREEAIAATNESREGWVVQRRSHHVHKMGMNAQFDICQKPNT